VGRLLTFVRCQQPIPLLILSSFWAALAAGPGDNEDSVAILQRIRVKVAAHLQQLPNYTCHEVIHRMLWPAGGANNIRQEQVEVEVAFLGRQELFAKPGEGQFTEKSIAKLVPPGTISSGAFGAHATNLFLGDAASFHYAGTCKKDGHKAYKYDFEVPEDKSVFWVQHDREEGIVGYEGSIWADFDTFDLVRIEIKADHITPRLRVRSVAEKMRYSIIKMKDSDFLLPYRSELEVSDSSGNFSTNAVELQQCKEYRGDSVITFAEPHDTDRPDPLKH
jgi:hypothetical protein